MIPCAACGGTATEALIALFDYCPRCLTAPYPIDEGRWLLTDMSDGEEIRFHTREAATHYQSYPWETIQYKPDPDPRNPLMVAFREYIALEQVSPITRELVLEFDDCLMGESPRGELAEMLRDVLGAPSSASEWDAWYDSRERWTKHAGKIIDRLLAVVVPE